MKHPVLFPFVKYEEPPFSHIKIAYASDILYPSLFSISPIIFVLILSLHFILLPLYFTLISSLGWTEGKIKIK